MEKNNDGLVSRESMPEDFPLFSPEGISPESPQFFEEFMRGVRYVEKKYENTFRLLADR